MFFFTRVIQVTVTCLKLRLWSLSVAVPSPSDSYDSGGFMLLHKSRNPTIDSIEQKLAVS